MTDFTVVSQVITSKTAIIRVAGDMLVTSFPALEDEFNKLLESGIIGVVIDLSGLDSLTSAGLGAIINLGYVLDERQGKLVVAAARPKVLGLVEMLGVQENLTMTETPEQAKKLVASIR